MVQKSLTGDENPTANDLAVRRVGALTRLEEEKRRRGSALLENRSFDGSQISAIEEEIAAIDEAADEETRRLRGVAVAARVAQLESLGRSLSELEEDRLKAVGEAENAARRLVSALNDTLVVATSMRRTIREMDTPVPLALAEGAFADRLSQRLAAVMGGITGHPARFGQVVWRASWWPADDSWVSSERAQAADDLLPLKAS